MNWLRKYYRSLSLSALISLTAWLALALPAAAVAPSSAKTGNLAVSPAIVQLNLAPGQTSAAFTVEVINNHPVPVTLQIQMNDFTALNQTGSVAFLGSNYPGNNLHGLAHWMQVSPPIISLPPGASRKVSVTIPSLNGLAPGGHYGAVIFRMVPPAANGTASNQLFANEEVSVLVFLTTAGGRTQALTLAKPQLNSIFTALPTSINLVFTNSGNTQTTPRGLVTITDNRGHELARGVINVDSGLVLPATSRLYQVSLRYAKPSPPFGTYHLHITYQAGDNGSAQMYERSFFYISRTVVAVVLLIALAGILLLIYLVGRHYHHYRSKP